MKRKIAIIAALFCIGCIVAEPATDIKAAGIQVAAAQTTLSADNSLEVLSLSAGTLSPDFTGKTVQYTATVPNDVTSVTVTATPVNEFATVQSITGNDNLQVGTNTIKVVVKAQNGALAQYTITLTREEGQAADGQTTDQPADGTDGQNAETETAEDDDTYNMEYLQQEYNDLSEQYAKEKSFSRNMMGIMAFVIAVLVVIIVNLLLRGSKRDDWDDEEDQDDWDWKSAKKVEDQEQQEDADFEENSSMEEENDIEPERRGFFHRKTKTADETEDRDDDETENEIGVSKIHKVHVGVFGRGMSDDLEDEDWDDEEEFSPVEKKHPEKKEQPEEKHRPERKEQPEEKHRPERKEQPERKHTPEKKHIPREEEEDDDLEIIDLNDL